jgi:hypothetical protein
MTTAPSNPVIFSGTDLLPSNWLREAQDGPVRTFNPALLRDGAGWIFGYRVVAPDGRRRLGLCRLDANLEVEDGSQVPLTDFVQFRRDHTYPEVATQWFADPRLYRFGQRTFVYWNSGWHEPHNCQFLQELDPVSLLPRGPARELALQGERQKLEKNWTFFSPDDDGELFAVYSIMPHRILTFSLAGDNEVVFRDLARTEWDLNTYPANHGGLRGGSPPFRHQGQYWAFAHSVHTSPEGYRYAAAAYSFSPAFPFAPTSRPHAPLELGNPFGSTRINERLNPAVGEVIYPCGAVHDGRQWLISYGINDETCAIGRIDHADVVRSVEPISARGSS